MVIIALAVQRLTVAFDPEGTAHHCPHHRPGHNPAEGIPFLAEIPFLDHLETVIPGRLGGQAHGTADQQSEDAPKQTGPGGEAARGPHGEPLAAGAALGWAAAFGSFSSECSINPANGMLFAISAYSSVKPACEATNSPGWRWLLLSG